MKGIEKVMVFSFWLRAFHWIMVATVTTLFYTGLYIGNPGFIGSVGLEPTFAVANLLSMETIRKIHFICAYILTASFIFRIYGWIVHRGDRLMPHFWKKKFWLGIVEFTKYYLFLIPEHTPMVRNHLARLSYFIVYLALFLEMITGFAMYAMINPNGPMAAVFGVFNHIFVDEYITHLIHHYTAWALTLFVLIHVYMVFRNDAVEQDGEMSSMMGGCKYLGHVPDDIGDVK